MKIYIGDYKYYLTAHDFLKHLTKIGVSENTIEKISDKIDDNYYVKKFFFILNYIRKPDKRTVKVKVTEQDTWSLDSTLSLIIAPSLRKYKEVTHVSSFVDDCDVPKELHYSVPYPSDTFFDNDKNEDSDLTIKRWNYVLDEMIWAFETDEKFVLYNIDPEDEYYKDNKFDVEGWKQYNLRLRNARILFGKYYSSLWN